jgi:hypothetical protein
VCQGRSRSMTDVIGWRDRDYARWTDEERRRFFGSPGSVAPSGRTSRRGRMCAHGAGWAVGASAVVFALGFVPRGHPLLPALHFRIPVSRPSTTAAEPRPRFTGPRLVRRGSFLTFHGRVPAPSSSEVASTKVRGERSRSPTETVAPTAPESSSADGAASGCESSSAAASKRWGRFASGRRGRTKEADSNAPANRRFPLPRWVWG